LVECFSIAEWQYYVAAISLVAHLALRENEQLYEVDGGLVVREYWIR